MVIFFIKTNFTTGFLICILCILYVEIANNILSSEFGFMKFYAFFSLFRKIT